MLSGVRRRVPRRPRQQEAGGAMGLQASRSLGKAGVQPKAGFTAGVEAAALPHDLRSWQLGSGWQRPPPNFV